MFNFYPLEKIWGPIKYLRHIWVEAVFWKVFSFSWTPSMSAFPGFPSHALTVLIELDGFPFRCRKDNKVNKAILTTRGTCYHVYTAWSEVLPRGTEDPNVILRVMSFSLLIHHPKEHALCSLSYRRFPAAFLLVIFQEKRKKPLHPQGSNFFSLYTSKSSEIDYRAPDRIDITTMTTLTQWFSPLWV